MRVLHVQAGNLFGGVESVLVALARFRGLCPAMEPSYAACFEGRLTAELRQAGVPTYVVGGVRLSRPWTAWRARRAFRRLLADAQPDVVVTAGCWSHALFAPLVRSAGLPVVYWCHDVPGTGHWLEWLARRIPPDLVLANSRFTQSGVGKLFPTCVERTCCFYNPIPEPPPTAAADRQATRASLGAPKGKRVLFLAARLEPLKGHRVLLEALGRLRDRDDWVCWIAGGPQRKHEEAYLASLQTEATRLGVGDRVSWLGQRSDVPRLLAAADIYCQPNIIPETFGNSFVEALYAGLPVVTSALGGACEIVDDTCGFLTPPGDAAALTYAVARLLDDADLRARLGACGPPRARQLCSPPEQMQRLHHALATVTAKRPAAAGVTVGAPA
jgi:glycosyltransferase involved in cell wall biosynthesis